MHHLWCLFVNHHHLDFHVGDTEVSQIGCLLKVGVPSNHQCLNNLEESLGDPPTRLRRFPMDSVVDTSPMFDVTFTIFCWLAVGYPIFTGSNAYSMVEAPVEATVFQAPSTHLWFQWGSCRSWMGCWMRSLMPWGGNSISKFGAGKEIWDLGWDFWIAFLIGGLEKPKNEIISRALLSCFLGWFRVHWHFFACLPQSHRLFSPRTI